MPSRRNARNKNNGGIHIQQQPTPNSTRPSPSTYPSPLPDEDDFIGQAPPAMASRPSSYAFDDDRIAEGIGNAADAPLLTFEDEDDAPPERVFDYEQESEEEEALGHQRSPVLSSTRGPTALESLSRTVKSSIHTVRSNIPISAAAPSTAVSRPVSFGSFLTNSRTASAGNGPMANNGGDTIRGYKDFTNGLPSDDILTQSLTSSVPQPRTGYPAGDKQDDAVLGSHWDTTLPGKLLLFLFYRAGFQIWDASNLASVSEVLNVNLEGKQIDSRVFYAAVIPPPKRALDQFKSQRPLVGLVHSSASTACISIYSLTTHSIVRRIQLPGQGKTRVIRFETGAAHIVVSTSQPAALHLISSSTFEIIHSFSSSELAAFANVYPASSVSPTSTNHISHHTNNVKNNDPYNQQYKQAYNVSIDNSNRTIRHRNDIDQQHLDYHVHQPADEVEQQEVELPSPVFALQGRLLAFASPPPKPDEVSVLRGDDSIYTSRPTSGVPDGVDVGSVAMKVGGSVFSGIKSLGGMAYRYGAAKLSESQGHAPPAHGRQQSVGGRASGQQQYRPTSGDGAGAGGGGIGKFFSKSTPSSNSTPDRHRRTVSMGGLDGRQQQQQGEVNVTPSRSSPFAESGYYVTIVDLASLQSTGREAGTDLKPHVISEFLASKSQPVARLSFSADGISLMVVPKDGQVTKVFQVRPGVPSEHQRQWQSYRLRRGRTSGVVEGTDWTKDGRWLALGTKKRTIHVFAVNPYGGQPDVQSHVLGKVSRLAESPVFPTELSPLVRLRTAKAPAPGQPRAPLSFLFLDPPSVSAQNNPLPTRLQPSSTSPHLGPGIHSFFPSSSPASVPSDSSMSHRQQRRPLNYQDILVFDPTDGQLTLKRILLDVRPSTDGRTISGSLNTGMSALSSALNATGTASISLPSTRFSSSVSPTASSGLHSQMQMTSVSPAKTTSSRRSSGISGMSGGSPDALPVELVGRESNVATWSLQRQKDWGELKKVVVSKAPVLAGRVERADWLAQAELSTFFKTTKSIYLAHQFFFSTLGEDYHALVRRYHFDFPGSTEIKVRKKVEVNAYPDSSGISGESFVEGYTIPRRDARRSSSPFDEPLTSALTGDFDYTSPQPVLPMLPNGTPGQQRAFPIRQTMAGIGDGMSEQLGRIRREMMQHRSSRGVRSPPTAGLNPLSTDPSSVPLEFDEEDEDFVMSRTANSSEEQQPVPPSPSEPIPATGIMNLDEEVDLQQPQDVAVASEEDDMWHRWGPEEVKAVEEQETFDRISVRGFMEEQQEKEEQERVAAVGPGDKKKRKKKGKK